MEYLITETKIVKMDKSTMYQIKTDTGVELSVMKIESLKDDTTQISVEYIIMGLSAEQVKEMGVDVSKIEELLNEFN